MDDLDALASPAIGAAPGAVVAGIQPSDFGPGVCDTALHISSAERILAYPERVGGSDNIFYAQGTLMFWYKPDYALTDKTANPLLRTTQLTLRGGLELKKTASGSHGSLVFALWPAGGDSGPSAQENRSTNLASANPTFAKDTWTHVAVSWDATNTAAVELRVFFDGVEQTAMQNVSFAGDVPPTSDVDKFHIGTLPNDPSGGFAEGWFDDFRIYTSALP
jgi:hypothetical protein